MVSDAQKALLYQPPGAAERQAARLAAAPAPPAAPAPAPKADAKTTKEKEAPNKPPPPNFCKRFLTTTGCPKSVEDCDYAHLNEADATLVTNTYKAALVKHAAKAKAKAGAKG